MLQNTTLKQKHKHKHQLPKGEKANQSAGETKMPPGGSLYFKHAGFQGRITSWPPGASLAVPGESLGTRGAPLSLHSSPAGVT